MKYSFHTILPLSTSRLFDTFWCDCNWIAGSQCGIVKAFQLELGNNRFHAKLHVCEHDWNYIAGFSVWFDYLFQLELGISMFHIKNCEPLFAECISPKSNGYYLIWCPDSNYSQHIIYEWKLLPEKYLIVITVNISYMNESSYPRNTC